MEVLRVLSLRSRGMVHRVSWTILLAVLVLAWTTGSSNAAFATIAPSALPKDAPSADNGLVRKVHGWHCARRYGRDYHCHRRICHTHKRWHRHRRACYRSYGPYYYGPRIYIGPRFYGPKFRRRRGYRRRFRGVPRSFRFRRGHRRGFRGRRLRRDGGFRARRGGGARGIRRRRNRIDESP